MTFTPTSLGLVSSGNSSTATLGSSAVFTGTGEDVTQYSSITITVISDVNSAAGGVSVQFSTDNTNWDTNTTYTYLTSQKFAKVVTIDAKYVRVVYTNGASPQTSFRLQTMGQNGKVANDTPQTVKLNPEIIDSFGRVRISNPYNVLELTHVVSSDSQESNSLTGSGTVTADANGPFNIIAVTTSGDIAINQTRQRGIYQPAKSILVYNTGVLNNDNNDTGVVTRIGYFDEDAGVYFQHTGDGGSGSLSIVLRTSVSGSLTETIVQQSAWNKDKLDGSGSSGITIDASKTQIFIVDLEWLGVGAVRCGVVFNGRIFYAHEFYNANANTVPYMDLGSLPCRFEARSTVAAAAGSCTHVCSSVIIEGGIELLGKRFTASRYSNTISVGAETPVIAIRLKSTGNFPKVNVYVDGFSAICTSQGNLMWKLYMVKDTAVGSVLTGSSFVSTNAESAVEYDISSTGITPTGTVINTGFISNNNDFSELTIGRDNNTILTTNVSGVSDLVILTMESLGPSETISASIKWKEII